MDGAQLTLDEPRPYRPVVLGRPHRSRRRVWVVGGAALVFAGAAVVLLAIGLGRGRPGATVLLSVPLGVAAFWVPLRIIRAHVRFDFDGRFLRVHDGVRSRRTPAEDVQGFHVAGGDFALPVVETTAGRITLPALRRFALGPFANHAEVEAELAALRRELGEVRRREAIRSE